MLITLITSICDTAGATDIDTDYYRAVVNADGSLNFINKSTGATILSDSPKFYFNYGTTTSTAIAVTNNSFEIDNNHDDIPDSWYVDKNYIRLSTEQASDGIKSLKFNATAPDYGHRRAYSPLITIPQDTASYTISIDSFMSSFTPGALVGVYAYYYGTVNGTGPAYVSSNYLPVPTYTGFWAHTSFNWTPPASARSFKLLIYMSNSSIATVYFDNVSITEKGFVYTSNGDNIEHTLIVNGDTTTITATDDSNPYTIVNHQYRLNTHSPYIDYIVTLQYKQDVFTTEERFDFVVPGQNAQVMTRDLRLTSFNASNTYWSDIYTPKVVRFANGLSFLGSDTMESMRLRTSGSNSQVSFYSDYGQNHPHFYYIKYGGGATTYVNETQRYANDTYSASVTFAIDTNESLQYLVKTRQPYGYDAVLTFTNHPDDETLARIKAVAYGSEDESDPDYGTKGIAGRGIGWTKGVFVSGAKSPEADLDDTDFKTLIDQMYQDGVVIVGHSITPQTDSRWVVAAGLATLSQYNSRGWIDHGAAGGTGNWEDLASQGAIKGSAYYILDLLDQYNYQYAWSYIDLTTDNYALNILKPSATADIRPFLFYNNRVDDNVNDNKKIYLWSTINTNKTPDYFYTNDRVDKLISERGVHISHEYFGYDTCENHAWDDNCGTIEIYPTFDCQLEYIAGKRAVGLLWSPPRAEVGDYLVPLKDVLVTYNSDGTVTVTNNSLVDVTGITLLAENNIQSVTIDNYELVSFGGSYGDKEMVLPTIASGDAVVLNISYGTKDSSVPTIASNDTGKNKVNEITGYWDDTNKILTMAAEGCSGNYSFTVTIPSLANRTIIVKDVTLDTIIGEYDASDSGAITFTASLDSLHTFKIAEKSFTTANYPVVDDFEDYNNTSNIIWETWKASGGTKVGYSDPNYAEVTIVHGGAQSMPVDYNNTKSPYHSEVGYEFSSPQNWTRLGVKALTLWFRGWPASVGSFVESPAGTYTMTASGTDIWNVPDLQRPSRFHDEFHYAYMEVSGDCDIKVKVESISNTDAFAKAGVMIRDSTDANSAEAIVCITPGNGVRFLYRDVAGGTTITDSNVAGITAPRWLRLNRTWNEYVNNYELSASYASNPSGEPNQYDWQQFGGPIVITTTNPVYVGLALTAHNAAATCTAVFSNLTIYDQDNNPVTPPSPWSSHQDIGIKSNTAAPLYVTLKDSTNATKTVTHPDPNIVLQNTWQEWNIALSDFAPVDQNKITKITIGVGNGQPGGTGTLYFDDIRLYPPRCVLSKRSADFAKGDYAPAGDPGGDCVIDYQELEIMSDYWLMTPPPDSNIDINGDGTINFRDFAVLVDMWLEEQLWP